MRPTWPGPSLAGAAPTTPTAPTPGPTVEFDPPEDVSEAADLVVDTIERLVDALVAHLPIILLALVLFAAGAYLAGRVANVASRGLTRTAADRTVVTLISRLLRLALVIGAALLALSVMGIPVGAALASLGIAGLAIAFALQNILENFVAGVLLLVRKPFRVGDQIRTGDYEGTVDDIDLRVTHLVDFDGETVLMPNADVFRHPLVNLTRRGSRRTRVMVGIDYRDDHDRARDVILAAVRSTDGVLDRPEPEVLLTALAESSVDFEVRYWTRPDILTVRRTQDRVLAAVKRAVQDAGLTIPWPIRTLVVDEPRRVGSAS